MPSAGCPRRTTVTLSLPDFDASTKSWVVDSKVACGALAETNDGISGSVGVTHAGGCPGARATTDAENPGRLPDAFNSYRPSLSVTVWNPTLERPSTLRYLPSAVTEAPATGLPASSRTVPRIQTTGSSGRRRTAMVLACREETASALRP